MIADLSESIFYESKIRININCHNMTLDNFLYSFFLQNFYVIHCGAV